MRMKLSQMWTALEIRECLRMMHEAKAVPLTIVMTSAVFEDFVRKVNEIMHVGETVTDGKRPTLFGLSVVVRDDMPDGMDWIISQRPPWHFDGVATVDELREAGVLDYLLDGDFCRADGLSYRRAGR